MSLTRAKSFDALYEACESFDLVVVPDQALANALNRRLTVPTLGQFATTPRGLVADPSEASERQQAFFATIDATDLDWATASYAVDTVLGCWESTGSIEKILDYDRYVSEAIRVVVDCLKRTPSTLRRLAETEITGTQSVAVIGVDQLTQLERSILPEGYTAVDPFTDGTFELPPFRQFESPTAVVDTVTASLSADTADQVAVIVASESPYERLLTAALESAQIPFYGSTGRTQRDHHRRLVALLHHATSRPGVRVGECQSLLAAVGCAVDIEHHDKRLDDLDLEATARFRSLLSTIRSGTFATAIDTYETATDSTVPAFRSTVASLGLSETPVTDASVTKLERYLQSYDITLDSADDGVLLVDPLSGGYVDRPLVFYLGLGDDWARTPPRRPWVSPEESFARNCRRFSCLLQNGVDQQYLVVDGPDQSPCRYFEPLIDGPTERFSAFETVRHDRTVRSTTTGFDREPVPVESTPPRPFSQSRLNTFLSSPREYLFDQLLSTPEKAYFVEGTLFHDFAELCVAHPSVVDKTTIDTVATMMVEAVEPFIHEDAQPLRRAKYSCGLRTIATFLDEQPPDRGEHRSSQPAPSENAIAERLGVRVATDHTERAFVNETLGLSGVIDLVHSPTRLVDYKSGRQSTPAAVVENATVDPPGDQPNTQAIAYLAQQRTEHPDEQLEFTFVHFLETHDAMITGTPDISDCLTTIPYHPAPFSEFAKRQSVFDALSEDAPNDCQKTFSKVDYATYRSPFEEYEITTALDADDPLDSPFGASLLDGLQTAVGAYKYVETGCSQALRYLSKLRAEAFYEGDIDAFETFLTEQYATLEAFHSPNERFPVNGIAGEPDSTYLANRDCLLMEERI